MRARRWIGIAGLVGLAGCYTGDATPLASDERRARTGLAAGDRVETRLLAYERCAVPGPVSQSACEPAPEAEALRARLDRCLAKELGDAHLRSSAGAAPRYRLEIRVRTAEGGFPTGGASGLGVMLGRWEERTTEIDVAILEPAGSRELGRVAAKAYGPSGWGVLFLLNILPIPMIQNAQTEAAACGAMAQSVATFLEDPEPHRWLPERQD